MTFDSLRKALIQQLEMLAEESEQLRYPLCQDAYDAFKCRCAYANVLISLLRAEGQGSYILPVLPQESETSTSR